MWLPLAGVRGQAVMLVDVTAEAAVNQRKLAVFMRVDADRHHGRAARTGAIAGSTSIDVTRIQTVGAVVAVFPAPARRPNE
jgi:hypothetical protein